MTTIATRREQDGVDLVGLADVLRRKGKVRGEPVALTLFHDAIPPSYEGRRVEPCAIVHHAMDLGERVYVDAEHQACLAGAWQAGFLDPPEEIRTGEYLAKSIPGFLPIAAERVKTGENVLPQGMLRGIGAAPLDQVPEDVRVDVVVIVCEPVVAATVGGVRTTIDGTPPRGAAGTSLCGELFAVPWHDDNVIVTPGDIGGRMFNKTRPNELFVIVPIRWAGHIPALLESTPDVPELMEAIKPGFRAEREAWLEERRQRAAAGSGPAEVRWDDEARALLGAAPPEIAEFAGPTLEQYAAEHGHTVITLDVMRAQMDSVGMRLEDVMALVDDAAPAPTTSRAMVADGAAAAEAVALTDTDALITASTALDTVASVDDVWTVLADIAGWSEVYPQLKDIEVEGDVREGARFSFRSGPGRIDAEVVTFTAGRTLVFEGRGMGATSRYAFTVSVADDRTRIAAAQSMSGRAIRPMRRMLQRIADTSLQEWVVAVAATAEERR